MTSEKEDGESFFTRVRVFVGIYAMVTANCVYLSWGALAIYVISYMRIRVKGETALNSAWLPAVNAACWGIGMSMGHKLTQIFGKRLCMTLGTLIFCGSMSMSYFSIQYSFVAFIITYGVVTGMSYGVLHALACMYIIDWCKRYVILATSFAITMEILGGIGITIMFTWYINPNNISSDRDGKYFTQNELLDKVPGSFLIYASISFTLGILAFCLIRDKPSPALKGENKEHNANQYTRELTCENNSIKEKGERQSWLFDYGSCNNGDEINVISNKTSILGKQKKNIDSIDNATCDIKASHVHGNVSEKTLIIPTGNQRSLSGCYYITQECENDFDQCDENATTKGHVRQLSEQVNKDAFKKTGKASSSQDMKTTGSQCVSDTVPSDVAQAVTNSYRDKDIGSLNKANTDYVTPEDMNLRQVLKTRTFYALLTMNTCSDFSLLILLSYYKRFGMEYYSDDHFLSSASLTLNMGMIVTVNIAGVVCEKFDFKKTVLFFNLFLCLLSYFFYLSALLDKWFYLIFIGFYGSCIYAIYSLLSGCVLKYFGKNYLTTIVGMVYSISFVINICFTTGIHYLLNAFGWLAVFSLVSVVDTVGFTVTVLGLPDKTQY